MHMYSRQLFLVCLLTLASTVSLAVTYKSTDSDGNVTYSGTPPTDGRKYEKIQGSHSTSSEPEASTPGTATPAATGTGSGHSDTVKKETAKNQEIRQQNCDIAKKNLEAYTVFRRVKDKDGNVIVLGDDERAKKIEESKKAVAEFCD